MKKWKRYGRRILFWILCSIFFFCTDFAQAKAEENKTVEMIPEKDYEDYSGELLEKMELDEIQNMMDELMGDKSFHLGEAIRQIISGEQPFSKDMFLEIVYEAVFGEIDRQRQSIFQIVLLVFAAAFFANFAKAFEKSQVGEISFYVIYLILFAFLMNLFGSMSHNLEKNLSLLASLMKAAAPAYYLAVAASVGVTTASLFYQIVLILILMIQIAAVSLLLPCVNLYVLLELVNHLSREEMLSRLSELLKMLVEWSLKTMLGVLVGMQVIQGLVAPVMDRLKRSAIGKTAGAIPGVGNVINSVTEIILTSAVLIRNSLGVVFLAAFLMWGLTPILRYGVSGILYKLLAAAAQPVSDKRIVGCINTMGEGCLLLMKILFTSEVLCMLTVIVVAGAR
ncbi:MAG: stage III sporulation protein AE [Eubacteriales bacterium]|nr:stage III sporulation protein AE [Eubacteriales bacterium]